jgi:hypothetical protein
MMLGDDDVASPAEPSYFKFGRDADDGRVDRAQTATCHGAKVPDTG